MNFSHLQAINKCKASQMPERPFVRNGLTLLSGLDPQGRAEKTADAVPVKEKTIYFCPSPLYGYGLARFLSRLDAASSDSAILCVEADSELYELSKKNIDSSLLKKNNLRITNICDADNLVLFVREAWGPMAFRRVEIVRFTGGWQLFDSLYNFLLESLRGQIATDWSNALTLARLGRLYIRNFIGNLSLVPHFPCIGNLSFGDSPVLVLGAGPSLDETLDAVNRYAQTTAQKSRPFKIICVDTCLGPLKERNIAPDLVVILESQHWNLRDFIGCKGWGVAAAIDLSALPQSALILGEEDKYFTTNQHEPTRTEEKKRGVGGFLFFTVWTELRIFDRAREAQLLPDVFLPLGSVGLTAVEISRRLTSGKIICSGIDFSFTVDKTHARGTPGHRGRLNAQTRLCGILNAAAYDAHTLAAIAKDGSSVRSNPIMQNYRALFEQEFGGDGRLFDIEGSGLSLGVKTLSLKEALSLLLREEEIYHEPTRIYLTTNSGQTGTNGRGEERREEFTTECAEDTEGRGEELEKLTEKVLTFFEGEKTRLRELRDILTGEAAADHARLNVLVNECDYLWAHFPDYSGGRQPPLGEESAQEEQLSFLKRLRAEIDPMLRVMERIK